MKYEDLGNLVKNSIRDAGVVIDNHGYFKEQNNEGLWKQFIESQHYVELFNKYFQGSGSQSLEGILSYLKETYEPWVEHFSSEHPHVPRAKRLGSFFGAVTAGGLFITITGALSSTLPPEYITFNFVPFIFSVASFGYMRQTKKNRKARLEIYKNLDEEVKATDILELKKFIDDNPDEIKEALNKDYSFTKEELERFQQGEFGNKEGGFGNIEKLLGIQSKKFWKH